jgi:hypothetical protein
LSKPIVSSGSSSKGMTTAVLRKNLKLGVQGAPLDKGQVCEILIYLFSAVSLIFMYSVTVMGISIEGI